MDKSISSLFQWHTGYGFFPVSTPPLEVYNSDYHRKYVGYMKTKLGHDLNVFRAAFTEKFWSGELVDVGSAAGHFMILRGLWRTKGCDINPDSADWLLRNGVYRGPFEGDGVDALSFFDTLEHLEMPSLMLQKAKRFVFVSIPIFKGADHVLSSRHFRPDEHFWYFTEAGLISYMQHQGFSLVGISNGERLLGREDIGTFAFQRTVLNS